MNYHFENYASEYPGATYISLNVETDDEDGSTFREDCFKFDLVSFINNSPTDAPEISSIDDNSTTTMSNLTLLQILGCTDEYEAVQVRVYGLLTVILQIEVMHHYK